MVNEGKQKPEAPVADMDRARAVLEERDTTTVPPLPAKTRLELLVASREELQAIINSFRVRYSVATRLGNRQAMEMIERESAFHLDSLDAVNAEIAHHEEAAKLREPSHEPVSR